MNLRKIIRETIDKRLNEVDWESEFSDVGAKCLNPHVVVKWLNDELDRLNANREKKGGKGSVSRGKRDIIITRGSIEDVRDSETGSINLDRFISNLTMEPDTIFDHNPKMEKSDEGRPQVTVNTGLPAIVGIVYDIENKKFYSVSTCPSAGACQIGCYARKGFYGMDDSKTMKLTRRLNLLLNDPQKYKERIIGELEPLAKNLKTSSIGLKDKMQLVIRWNDAGDFFGDTYFRIAKEVTKELLDKGYNIKSYAYTKRGDYVMQLDKDQNFVINFSTDAHKKDVESIAQHDPTREKLKYSHRVPKEIFADLFQKTGPHYTKGYKGLPVFSFEEAPEELKDRIYKKYGKEYNFSRDSLKFTFELPANPGEKNEYNVIVLPTGDSDIGAQRSDVKMSFLLVH